MGERPTRYNWVKSPVQRQLQSGIVMLDDDVLGTLKRFECMVWKNPAGVEGNGFMCLESGQKTPLGQVLLMLARTNPAGVETVKRHLALLKDYGEVAMDSKGRPFLKHWKTDRGQSATNTSEATARTRDRDLVPKAIEFLPWFFKAGEPRTEQALCEWLGPKMKKCPRRTMPRVVALLKERGVLVEEDGIISVSAPVLPSQAAPAPVPPFAEELEPEGFDMIPSCRGDKDIDSIAEEVFFENPIASIDEPPTAAVVPPSVVDSASPEEGGTGAGACIAHVVPVGHSKQAVHETVRLARRISPKAGNKKPPVRPWKDFGFTRELSGGCYTGWVEGSSPHPRRSPEELRDFKAEHLWSCDLIDAMMYLGPDGSPPGHPVYPKGQEAAYKSLLAQFNKRVGLELAEQAIRERVFGDYIEMLERQRAPFKCDAAVLVKCLKDVLADLPAMK